MQRYDFSIHSDYFESIDGGWIRYADHVEAMKRIAGDGGQQVERETLISVLENEQNNLAASRRQCGKFEGARWDALQKVIEYLSAAPAPSASPAALTDAEVEAAARELCRLQDLDPDKKYRNHPDLEPADGIPRTHTAAWEFEAIEVRKFLRIQRAITVAHISAVVSPAALEAWCNRWPWKRGDQLITALSASPTKENSNG